ncbi:MAG: hypothetical protein WCV41_02285 [Patescibacteria group bacterium]
MLKKGATKVRTDSKQLIVSNLLVLVFLMAGCASTDFFGSPSSLFAGHPKVLLEAHAVEWDRAIGGTGNDQAYSVQQTFNGAYIIAGLTNSFNVGFYDVYLVKMDSEGSLLWAKTFGGAGYDQAYAVRQTSDNGYIVAGVADSFGAGFADVYVIKTDTDGNLLWQKTFGGADSDCAYAVQQTSDGGYIIAGLTDSFGAGKSDAYLVKTDTDGSPLWQKTFGGAGVDDADSVQQTSDGGYIVAGKTSSFGAGKTDIYLFKTDAAGNLLWEKTFGGSDIDDANSVQQTSDGGYIVAGKTSSFGSGETNAYLLKTGADGNLLWAKVFGDADDSSSSSVRQTADGGYIVAGETKSFGAKTVDVYLIKTDINGNLLWQKIFGGASIDRSASVQQTSDDGYIVAGETNSFGFGNFDVYLAKIAPE